MGCKRTVIRVSSTTSNPTVMWAEVLSKVLSKVAQPCFTLLLAEAATSQAGRMAAGQQG